MTPLQLKQLVAAGGIAGELAGMVIEQQRAIDTQQKFIDNVIETQKKRYGDGMGLHLDMITIAHDWSKANET